MDDNKIVEDPNYVEHKIDNIKNTRELEEKQKQAEFEKNMQNIDFKRDHYMSELEKIYNRIPLGMYYKAEYEEITEKYNETIDEMETLTEDKDFLDAISRFEKYRAKKLPAKKVYLILAIFFTVLLVGIVTYFIIAARV